MALTIKSWGKSTLQITEGDLYVVPSGKAAIVKSIRLVNTGTSNATVNLFIQRGTGTHFRIAPKDLILAMEDLAAGF